jgi:DNA-binding beta-propeller fold protein YncE
MTMPHARYVFAALALCVMAFCVTALSGSARAEEASQYRLVRGFPHLPPGLKLGAVSGVAADAKDNVLVFHRGDARRPVLVFDRDGKFLRSFGEGLFTSTHGLRVDPDGNVWATDNANHTVVKFGPDGKVLMTLGEKGVAGDDERHFNKPTDVAVAPNGDLYVSDGYGNSRVVKFDKAGRFLLAWGKKGAGPGEFDLPHAVRLDSKGNVYVADRENKRVQVFDPDGKFLRQFAEGVAPYGLFITPDDTVLVADGVAHRVVKMTTDGKVMAQWGTGGREPGNFLMPHGICVGPDGAVYVAEVTGARVQKFVHK